MADAKYTFCFDEKFKVNSFKKADAKEKITQWYNITV